MGSDEDRILFAKERIVFQSTLPYGERQMFFLLHPMGFLFQSTLPYGERLLQEGAADALDCFNPRSRMGSDWII